MINLKDINKKQGAMDALSLLLASKQRKIRIKNDETDNKNNKNDEQLKMPKNVEIVDVDEEDKQNGEEETAEERENRLAAAETNSKPEVMQRDLNAIKNEIETAAQERELKKQQKEYREHVHEMSDSKAKKLISSGKMKIDYKWFYKDLENAINDQIEQSNKWEDSYDAFNSTYAESDILMPGEVRQERKQKPIISVYFDLSGSLSRETIAKAKESLSFLTDLENSGDIESYTAYYFAENISDNPEQVITGATTAYPKILQHVKQTGADNVIIFTDDDFDRQSGYIPGLPYVKIDGCMWWMWANGEMAKKAWPHLTSSNQYATYHYDIN